MGGVEWTPVLLDIREGKTIGVEVTNNSLHPVQLSKGGVVGHVVEPLGQAYPVQSRMLWQMLSFWLAPNLVLPL